MYDDCLPDNSKHGFSLIYCSLLTLSLNKTFHLALALQHCLPCDSMGTVGLKRLSLYNFKWSCVCMFSPLLHILLFHSMNTQQCCLERLQEKGIVNANKKSTF